MKKKLFCLLMILVLPVCLLFTGCDEIEKVDNKEDTSVMICVEKLSLGGTGFYILVHKETRVMYMAYYSGGVSVMYNADGKPMIYDGEL